jgi:phosphotriesterase-related protein
VDQRTNNLGEIMTVRGAIAPEEMGVTLHHEHIMSTFGAECARYPDYPVEKLFTQVTPYLEYIKGLGCQTIIDCTAAYFGRHPEILRKFSTVCQLHILTNTGYYAAAGDRYVPTHAYKESASQIAARWTREWSDGIDGTGIYPGFIKTAVDAGPLSDIDAKLITAAARTHLQTGLVIQTHTGDNQPAVGAIFSIFETEKVHPSAWIWIHAHTLKEVDPAVQAAKLGARISLDNIDEGNAAHILKFINGLKQNNLFDHILLSHDGDSYINGDFRPYHYLFTHFIPMLLENGFGDQDIQQLIVDNPRQAYTVRVRAS